MGRWGRQDTVTLPELYQMMIAAAAIGLWDMSVIAGAQVGGVRSDTQSAVSAIEEMQSSSPTPSRQRSLSRQGE